MPLTEARLAITDDGASRGDGAFESVGVWGGRAFRLDEHVDRLNRSLDAVLLPRVDGDLVLAEATSLLDDVDGDALLRIYVTASGTRLAYVTDQPQRPPIRHLVPQPAPWIRPHGTFHPAGAKSMSYMPNMAATRAAQAAGGDDALLLSLEGWVLEGPTFAVFWVADGCLHAAPTELGIVDSITRRAVLEIAGAHGIVTDVAARSLDALLAADEVMLSSAVRPLLAVERVADRRYTGPRPVHGRVAGELARQRYGR